VETPKPQEGQNEAQTKLDDLLGPAPISNEEKATNAAEAMGVTLTPEVAKPLTDGPVLVVESTPELKAALEKPLEATSEQPIKVMNQPEGAVTPAEKVEAVVAAVAATPGLALDQIDPAKLLPKKSKRKTKKSKKPYHRLEKPRRPAPHGLFDLKAKAGKTLGVKCIFCKGKLKYKSGRPPIICKKLRCFRDLRNAYRRDYAKATG
jgi:hypothetical protein